MTKRLTEQEKEDKILLENSIERVINTSISIASASSHEDAYTNVEDWEYFKPIVVKLWNEARNRAFERILESCPVEEGDDDFGR